jgi:signal transduction histidine kinase
MLNNLPKNIIRYLIEELPSYAGILIFKTDADGLILDFHGAHDEYLAKKPNAGKPIHEYVDALHGMIPPLVSPMVLNKIQLTNNIYTDIHIVGQNENEFWIFLYDQSREVESIRGLLQQLNEAKYNEEKSKKNSTERIFNPLEVFDYLSLIVINETEAHISGNQPFWFKQIKETSNKTTINFTETFPYLEVFMFEAHEFWELKKDGKLKSGIWSETLNDGTEILLTAFAIFHNSQKIILIHPMEDEVNNKQMALQMAREQKLAYEQLEKADKKLRILLDYKDKFVSIISHDLRSPVASVLGIAEMLVNDEEELSKIDPFYKEMIFGIREEMMRLLDYNDKLYHWSNLELGNFEIVKTKCSLQKIITTAKRTAENKLIEKKISFTTNLKDDIFVNVDLTLFLQVLNNLMANAIKFTPENGNISIEIKKGKNLQIAVVDSGVGMSQKVMDNIFNGFARNSTLGTSGEKGTGLGLGIVKKIIDAHNFNIHAESEEGKGSRFIIELN